MGTPPAGWTAQAPSPPHGVPGVKTGQYLREPVCERSTIMPIGTATAEAAIRVQVASWLHAVLAMEMYRR